MKRFDALVVLLRAVGVYCGVHGVALFGQYIVASSQDAGANTFLLQISFLAQMVVYLTASPLLIWGAKFCARLCGESDDPEDEEEDTSDRQKDSSN
jgi:hypothetical protein